MGITSSLPRREHPDSNPNSLRQVHFMNPYTNRELFTSDSPSKNTRDTSSVSSPIYSTQVIEETRPSRLFLLYSEQNVHLEPHPVLNYRRPLSFWHTSMKVCVVCDFLTRFWFRQSLSGESLSLPTHSTSSGCMRGPRSTILKSQVHLYLGSSSVKILPSLHPPPRPGLDNGAYGSG